MVIHSIYTRWCPNHFIRIIHNLNKYFVILGFDLTLKKYEKGIGHFRFWRASSALLDDLKNVQLCIHIIIRMMQQQMNAAS